MFSIAAYRITFSIVTGLVLKLRPVRLSTLSRGSFISSAISSKSRTLSFSGIIFSAKNSSIFSCTFRVNVLYLFSVLIVFINSIIPEKRAVCTIFLVLRLAFSLGLLCHTPYFIELPQWDLGKLSGGSAVRLVRSFESVSRSTCSSVQTVRLCRLLEAFSRLNRSAVCFVRLFGC